MKLHNIKEWLNENNTKFEAGDNVIVKGNIVGKVKLMHPEKSKVSVRLESGDILVVDIKTVRRFTNDRTDLNKKNLIQNYNQV